MSTVRVRAAIALFSGLCLSPFSDLIALAVETTDWNAYHSHSLQRVNIAYIAVKVHICNTTRDGNGSPRPLSYREALCTLFSHFRRPLSY